MANFNRRPSEIIFHLLAFIGLFMFMTVNGRLLKTLENAVVLVNDSIRLSCQSDIPAEIHFYHNGNQMNSIGTLFRPYKDRFKKETTENHTYTLVNGKAGPEDAGVYMCHDEEARGQSSSANLTVLNTRLLCESNMHANGYIGPNTCNLQQEFMTFSCSVSFNGAPPRLLWRASNDSQPINSSVCHHQPNRVNCHLTLTSDPSYDGTFFTCLTAQPSGTQYNCSTEVIKVQHFSLDRELKPAEKVVGEEVECSVRSNLSPHFKWLSSKDNQETVVSNTRQHVIENHGLYWCSVSYNMGDVQCSSTSAVINSPKSVEPVHSSARFWIVLAFLLFIAIIAVALFIYIKQLRKTRTSLAEAKSVVETELADLKTEQEDERTKFSAEKSELEAEVADLRKIFAEKSELERKVQNDERKNFAEKLMLEKKLFQPSKETVPYAENPVWVKTIVTKASREHKRDVYGIAILEDELFAVSKKCKEIEIYELNDLGRSEEIAPKVHQIEDLENPRDMVSCSVNNCLYIRNYKEVERRTEILRISPVGDVEHKWEVKEKTGQLSVGNDGNVFVAVRKGSKVMEYTSDGDLIREIEIPKVESIVNLRHVISLQSGYFALCHGDSEYEIHRICIIGDHGHLIKSYGSSETQVNLPAHLARDGDDAIIVADRKNHRVLLLTPQLEFKRELLVKENGLENPRRVCLDMKRGFLLVADNILENTQRNFEGRVLAYEIVKSTI